MHTESHSWTSIQPVPRRPNVPSLSVLRELVQDWQGDGSRAAARRTTERAEPPAPLARYYEDRATPRDKSYGKPLHVL
jgi:hypothetical protein